MTQTESRISKAAAADGERRRPKVGLEKLLDNRELRQACTSCRISVYWEGEDEYFKGTITSCRKAGSRLAFHVEYDDGDTDVEALGEAGAAFKWHGPRARSGDPPYHDTMRAAMAILRPQNLQQDADPAAQAPAASTSGENLTGHAAVGWRVSLWWSGTREWAEGEVLAYKEARRRHHVVFADGEDEWLCLEQERVRWLGNTRQRGSALRPIAFGLEGPAPKGHAAVKWRVGLHSAALGRFLRAEIAEFDGATGRHRVEFLEEAVGEREWVSLTAAKVAWRFPPGHMGADSKPGSPAASGAPESSGATVTDRSGAGEAVSSGSHKRDKTPAPPPSAKRQKVRGKDSEAPRKGATSKGGAPTAAAKPGKAGCTRSATSQSPEKAAAVHSVANNALSSATAGALQHASPADGASADGTAADKPARRPHAAVPAPRAAGHPQHSTAAKGAARRDSAEQHGKDSCTKKRRMQAPPPRPHAAAAAAQKATRPHRDFYSRPRRPALDSDGDDGGGCDGNDDVPDGPTFAQRFFAESYTRATRDLQRAPADFGNDAKALLAATESRAAFLRSALQALDKPETFWVPCQPQRNTVAAAARAAAAAAAAAPATPASPQSGTTRAPVATARVVAPIARAPLPTHKAPEATPAAARPALAPHGGATGVRPATAAVAMAPPPRMAPPQLAAAQGVPRRAPGSALPRAAPPPLRPAATGIAPAPRVATIALPPTAASAAAAAAAVAAAAAAAPATAPRLASAAAAEGTCVPHKVAVPTAPQVSAAAKAPERPLSTGHSMPTNGVRDVAQLLSSAGKGVKLGQKPHRVSVGGGAVTPPAARKAQQNGVATPPTGGGAVITRIVLDKPAATCGQQAALKAPVAARVVPARRVSADGASCASAAAATAGGPRPSSSPAMPPAIGLKGGSAGSGGPSRAG